MQQIELNPGDWVSVCVRPFPRAEPLLSVGVFEKVTEKGYNVRNDKNGSLLFKKHLYPVSGTGNLFRLWYTTTIEKIQL